MSDKENSPDTLPDDQLTPAHYRAIGALVEGKPVKEAATIAGVSERTLHRWRQNPTFVTALSAASGATLSDIVARLKSGGMGAVDTLVSIQSNPKISPSVRVAAARAVLENLTRLLELSEFEGRLEILEERLRNV